MSSSTVRAVVTALIIFSTLVLTQAQTQTSLTKVLKAGSVSGKITVKGKGLAGIGVSLRRPDYNPFETLPRATTDQDGNYKLTNISPGPYNLIVSAPAFVSADEVGFGRSIVVGEGDNIESINFSVVKGGVITGKIVDAEGHPAVQQQVRLFRESGTSRPQPGPVSPVNTVMTDDRGIYRMFGLTTGRYKVSAGRGEDNFSNFNSADRAFHKEVFYPDATDEAKATVLQVSEGAETTNIDITLGGALDTFKASGRVVNNDQPVANFRFTLIRMNGERQQYLNTTTSTNNRGDFTIEGLIPGKYMVYLYSEANNDLHAEDTTFEIVDSDVSGITIRLAKGASISGVVVLETEDKEILSKLPQYQVIGYVRNPETKMGASARSSIGPDGSFRLGGLGSGTANIQLVSPFAFDQMKGFIVGRVERDGVVQPRGIEIKEGEQISGVKLFVSYGNATLRGVVNFENGTLPPNSRIYIRLIRSGDAPVPLRPPTVDERGHFIAQGLPPGTYEVLVSLINLNLKGKLPPKQTVVLQDNTITDISFTIDLSELPKP